ncbi:MAG: helix-turn-helix transcriptional regulator [Hyphomonadaceae bacterium]|nr:helix-turn-helix transcriptional regulator [Hyphomonadaceae bacterium]
MRNSLRDPRYRAVISRLIEIRDELDLSQRELAERLGQSRSYVSKVEIFERRMDFVQLVEWLRALGADERKFLSEMLKDIPVHKRKRG